MKNIDYALWGKYIIDITTKYKISAKTVLEIGGGNGNLARILDRKFSRYVLSDKSHQFLREGKYKKEKISCDMNALPFKYKFDLVIAAFDTVNYVSSNRGLKELLKEVSAVLKDGGIFTFDVSLERNSLPHVVERKKIYKYKDQIIEHSSFYNQKKGMHQNTFAFYRAGKLVEKENHKQKIFPFEFLLEQIDKSDFFIIDCLEAFGFRKGKASSKRVQFILKKEIKVC